MISQTCSFETSRLTVFEWRSAEVPTGWDRASIVIELLTSSVTRSLPAAWHGDYTRERAHAWIREREGEGVTLLVVERASGEPIGLVIVGENSDGDPDGVSVRLGYLLAESAWGKGLASELIGGFVSWCRSQPQIRSIAGGVETGNVASARALTKNGFAVNPGESDEPEQMYELRLRG